MDKYMIDLVYRSFDGKLSEQETARLQQGLTSSAELQNFQAQVSRMRDRVKSLPEPVFSYRFTEKVMQKIISAGQIDTQELFFNTIFRLFKPVAVGALMLILVIAVFNMASIGDISVEAALGVPDISLEDTFDPVISLIAENEL
ncbi:MAG: hypothetical protein E4H13_14715 [Calditrichales bacterium]|nr:MAG: hypothetical protein E4H13_14715 [Calditrichales bacterium]